jgi:hypothetical protein
MNLTDNLYNSLEGGSVLRNANSYTDTGNMMTVSLYRMGFEPTIPAFELAKTVRTLGRMPLSTQLIILKFILISFYEVLLLNTFQCLIKFVRMKDRSRSVLYILPEPIFCSMILLSCGDIKIFSQYLDYAMSADRMSVE